MSVLIYVINKSSILFQAHILSKMSIPKTIRSNKKAKHNNNQSKILKINNYMNYKTRLKISNNK